MMDTASGSASLKPGNGKALPWIVVVGGFLGAGKTTLLLSAAQELGKRGIRSAVILNDQSDGLVDTELAELHGVPHGEVTGGCFCCRFSDLVDAMEKLRSHEPDVIFAEPVGSCTDISATILHPLQEYGTVYRLAPYTVLVDPERAEALLRSDADSNLAFLFRKQIEEADILCFSKSDLAYGVPEIGARVRQISGRSGQGVAAWVDEVLSGESAPGGQILEVDYEQYAQAEAALAWLNLRAVLKPAVPQSPALILGPLLDGIDAALSDAQVSIVHMKAIASGESGFVKAALCGNRLEPQVEGMLDASPTDQLELVLNLRCVGEAEIAKEIVERCLDRVDATIVELRIRAFHPAAPNPERRVSRESVAAGKSERRA
jgi:CobW/HypB/UreG, nucleotide-binding domain